MSGVFEAFTRKYRKQSAQSNQVDNPPADPTQKSFTAADFESLNAIRLLVFVESDSRRLIYDSQSVISNDPNFRLAEEAANSDAGINIQSDRLNVHKGARGIQSATGLSGNSLPTRHGLSFLESRSGSKVAPSTPRRKVGTSRSSHDPSKSKNSREPVIKYQSDTKLLGEMIFGTMSMVYHGVTLKIHPNVGSDSRRPHTMISYLSQFNLEVLSKQTKTKGESFADLENDLYGDDGLRVGQSLDCLDGSQSGVEMMTSLPSSLASLFIHDDLWSSGRRNTASRGVATPDATSIYSGAGGGGGGGVNSTIFRSKAADSISSVSSMSKQLWQTSIPAFYTASHDLSDLSITSSGAKRSRSKLGIALTFPSSIPAVEELIQTHIAVIEGYLMHVKNQVEFGMAEKESFFDFVNATYLEVKEKILRLFFDERNMASTWLNINAGSVQTSAVSVFMTSLSRFGSREMTFLSGVVTELLCRHLSWINTVYIDEEQAELDQSLASRSVVNKRWAQLCDLFGIASSPAKCYKIVICGKIQNSVRKYADVLSYFIRVSSLNKRYIRVPSIQAILETTSSNESDLKINQTVSNHSDWTFSDDVTSSLRHNQTTNVDDQSNSPDNFVCVELVDAKKLDQDDRKASKDGSSSRTRQDSLKLLTDFGDPLFQNELDSGSTISTVKHETSKSYTGSAVTPGSRDSKDRNSSSARESSNVSPPFLGGERSEKRESHLLNVVSPVKNQNAAPDDDAKIQSMAFVEEWMQNSANVSNSSSSDLIQTQAGPSNSDAKTVSSQSLPVSPLTVENPDQTIKPRKITSPLQDSGFSDNLDGPPTPLGEDQSVNQELAHGEKSSNQELTNQESDDQETDSGMPSDDLSLTQRNLKGYTIVPLVDGQSLCAPEVFPCKAPASCLAHSLIGIQSSKYSQDAMLQTCNDPGQALLEAMHDSNRNFIVESKPCVLVIDIDKQKFYICENGSQYAPPLNCSKSISDTLMHALALRRLGLKDHFCVSMIERSLHVLVCQSLALSHKLLQHPDPVKILESLAFHSTDLTLLKSIAAAVKTMEAHD